MGGVAQTGACWRVGHVHVCTTFSLAGSPTGFLLTCTGGGLSGLSSDSCFLTGGFSLTSCFLTGSFLTGSFLTGSFLTGCFLTGVVSLGGSAPFFGARSSFGDTGDERVGVRALSVCMWVYKGGCTLVQDVRLFAPPGGFAMDTCPVWAWQVWTHSAASDSFLLNNR